MLYTMETQYNTNIFINNDKKGSKHFSVEKKHIDCVPEDSNA